MPILGAEEIEVNVVGSSVFGRYPKISLEKTYNMYISDEWLINYPGFKKVSDIGNNGEGRALFNSIRGGFLIAVVGDSVYRINQDLVPFLIGNIATNSGTVYIDENLVSQICIVDGQSAYIYNYSTGPATFTLQVLTVTPASGGPYPVVPGYVSYHNTFFLIASAESSPNNFSWYAFRPGVGPTVIEWVPGSQFPLQTKPDFALYVHRLPGRGNNVLVLGSSVGEVWTQVGSTENYRRVSSFNIDNGVVSVSTVASNEEFICWLGKNENNSPSIMVTDGSNLKRISTDGIDHVLDQLQFPEQSDAFFYRNDGHLFYQITFFNPADNLSIIYDFNTQQFFHISDENLNFHPARSIAFFNGNNYFVSINDPSIYDMSSNYVTYDYSDAANSVGEEIPRIRICKTIRKKNSDRFRVAEFKFWLEQGMSNDNILINPRVDMSFSKNGNQSFSNIVSRELNPTGKYKNQIQFQRLGGECNEFTVQLRFWGFTRFVVNNGIAEIY